MFAVLGWFGSVLYLVNHGYISTIKNWNPTLYYVGNLLAALSLVISSLYIQSYQAVVINGFWALISIFLLSKLDIGKLPFSRRLFYSGFLLFFVLLIYVASKYGWNSITFYTCLGWSSSYVFCLSYFLFCSKKLKHINYLLLNFYAASALLPLLYAQQNWPVFTLEVCWAGISLFGVIRRIEEVHLID